MYFNIQENIIEKFRKNGNNEEKSVYTLAGIIK